MTIGPVRAAGPVDDIDPDPDLIAAAVDLIGPLPDERARCRRKIVARIGLIRDMARLGRWPSPAETRDGLRRIANALRRAGSEMDGLRPHVSSYVPDALRLRNAIADAIAAAERAADALQVPPPANRSEEGRLEASRCAFGLLSVFARSPCAVDERFVTLAALLLEAAGQRDRDMRRPCRHALDEAASRQKLRAKMTAHVALARARTDEK